MAYAGQEGFCIGSEFRKGTQHSQKGAPAFIVQQIRRVRTLEVTRVLVRLDSGKFNTNALVFAMGCLAYNVLRVLGIRGKAAFKSRHPAKRKRLKTIIQELILVPARILRGSNQIKLDLGRSNETKKTILALQKALEPPLSKAA